MYECAFTRLYLSKTIPCRPAPASTRTRDISVFKVEYSLWLQKGTKGVCVS